MPITFASAGDELEVRKIGADEKIKKHLIELGITVGSKITLLQTSACGVIVAVKQSRLCLDKAIAIKIIVA